ncbi:MAG: hypothetical protein EP330_13920 [Deltaproteobacteria bacterium]|nr:MAG: hypothetical protein EP330_13920 [Deltaproteobacteria bacterium]
MKYASLSLAFLVACSNGSNDILIDRGMSLAEGVTITRVAIYQGPEATLAENGVAAAPDLPLIAGRDALLRVFYEAPGRAGTPVTARVGLASEESFEGAGTLAEVSAEGDITSTLNIRIPGDALVDSLDYRVVILDEGNGSEEALGAMHPDEGFESHPLEPAHVFKVTIVPYVYNADGSGRAPDTSAEAVASYRERFMQLYPISDVEITVHDPVQWSGAIQPNGTGWQEVGFNLFGLRNSEGASDDEYYYGMFNPSASADQFCAGGCLLGVTLLNNDPVTTGDPNLNLALGVGFPEWVEDTMLHEIGHAHGRPHAPCGQGLDPQSIDASYPYSDGKIGALAYDLVGSQLVEPDAADIMSYCYPQWISEYNYRNFWTRMDNIRGGGVARSAMPATLPGDLVFVEGDGKATWAASGVELPYISGASVDVRAGFAEQVEGRFYRYDHLPGGWLVLPELGEDVDTVSFEIDGKLHTVSR